MKRASPSRRARIRIFDAAQGRCHICKLPIHAERGEKWEVEHIKPLHLGGTNDERNLAPAHKFCHAEKSGGENTGRAKADRMRANYLGIGASGPKLAGGRRSPISKTIRGEVIARRSQAEKHRAAMARRQIGGEA